MKYLVGLVLCALLGVGNAVFCFEESDCDPDECCLAFYCTQLLGNGVCTKKGKGGSPCNDEDAKLPEAYGNKYLTKCPCKEGYDCMPGMTSGTKLQQNASQKCKRVTLFSKINKKKVGSDSLTKNKK